MAWGEVGQGMHTSVVYCPGRRGVPGQYNKPWHPLLQRSVRLPLVSSRGILLPLRFWKGSRVTLWWFKSPLLQIAVSCTSRNDSLGHLYFPLVFLSHFSFLEFVCTSQLNFSFFLVVIFCSLTHLPEPFCLFPLYIIRILKITDFHIEEEKLNRNPVFVGGLIYRQTSLCDDRKRAIALRYDK